VCARADHTRVRTLTAVRSAAQRCGHIRLTWSCDSPHRCSVAAARSRAPLSGAGGHGSAAARSAELACSSTTISPLGGPGRSCRVRPLSPRPPASASTAEEEGVDTGLRSALVAPAGKGVAAERGLGAWPATPKLVREVTGHPTPVTNAEHASPICRRHLDHDHFSVSSAPEREHPPPPPAVPWSNTAPAPPFDQATVVLGRHGPQPGRPIRPTFASRLRSAVRVERADSLNDAACRRLREYWRRRRRRAGRRSASADTAGSDGGSDEMGVAAPSTCIPDLIG
jgi:hypothetical protein